MIAITDVSPGAVQVVISNEPTLVSVLQHAIPDGFIRRTEQHMDTWVFLSPHRGTALDVLSEWAASPVRRPAGDAPRPLPPPTRVEQLYQATRRRPASAERREQVAERRA
jgi:hypothetical protein